MDAIVDLIERHQSEILGCWTEGAASTPFARGLSPPELANMMPEYLALLGSGDADAGRLSEGQQAVIERHMSNRLRQGFVLNEILTEFALLSRCLARFIESQEAGERPAPEDLARVSAEISLTCVAATILFNEHMLEDEQTEKRCARIIQKIAGEAAMLRAGSTPWRERLTEVVRLIMETMGANTAALLLFDTKSDQLIMCASTGDAVEHLAAHVSSLDPSTFAGKIASRAGESTEVEDAETTELEVSEELRHSGIHSLLGVRLTARHLLRGVIYIGVRERRPFTASEVRRIEGLGEALAVHLDNAQLNAALRAKIGEVEAEARLRGRFVSVIMHDLQAPLAAARAGARVLSATGGEAATEIAHNLDRMDRMIGGLVDAENIRGGKPLLLVLEDCDLSAIARDVVEDLRGSHMDRIVLQAERRVRGMWSAEMLRRAIEDLAVNALDHGAPSEPVVVSVRRTDVGAEVSVHNAGREISAESQLELFHPFSFHGTPIQSPPHGWGIGLTLVWGCAEAHGGHVAVESLHGRGTTFTLSIPNDARPYVD